MKAQRPLIPFYTVIYIQEINFIDGSVLSVGLCFAFSRVHYCWVHANQIWNFNLQKASFTATSFIHKWIYSFLLSPKQICLHWNLFWRFIFCSITFEIDRKLNKGVRKGDPMPSIISYLYAWTAKLFISCDTLLPARSFRTVAFH